MTDQKIETLSFSIGGFHAGWEQIIWHENKLQHQFFQHIYPEHIKIPPDKIYSETVPLEKDWEIFWKEVDKLKVWSWKKDYLNEGMLDGTQWELEIKIEGKRRRKMYGSNAYPKPKGTFESFINALNKLSKSNLEYTYDEF